MQENPQLPTKEGFPLDHRLGIFPHSPVSGESGALHRGGAFSAATPGVLLFDSGRGVLSITYMYTSDPLVV